MAERKMKCGLLSTFQGREYSIWDKFSTTTGGAAQFKDSYPKWSTHALEKCFESAFGKDGSFGRAFQSYPSQTKSWDGGTKDEMLIFDAVAIPTCVFMIDTD